MKKLLLIIAASIGLTVAAQPTSVAGIYTKAGGTQRNNLVFYPGGNIITAANCLDVTDGADSTSSLLYVRGSARVAGGYFGSYVEKSSSYTVVASNYVINCVNDTITVTLPLSASARKGQIFVIKSSDAGTITVATTGGQTIDGASTKDVETKKTLIVMSTGSGWIILAYS